jgi:hypothetical protein
MTVPKKEKKKDATKQNKKKRSKPDGEKTDEATDAAPSKKFNYDTHVRFLIDGYKKNYLFYITLFFCFYIFVKNSKHGGSCVTQFGLFLRLIFSFMVVTFYGYLFHYLSHLINFKNHYKDAESIITKNTVTKYLMDFVFSMLDFHHTTHHESSVSKQPLNVAKELSMNLFTQGVGMFLFVKVVDTRIMLLWALLYATVHNINYVFTQPKSHMDHHKDCQTNYDLSVWDILLNTKYDINDVEDYNHMAFNTLVITVLIVQLGL